MVFSAVELNLSYGFQCSIQKLAMHLALSNVSSQDNKVKPVSAW